MKTFKNLREQIQSNKVNESHALIHTTATDMDDNDRHITKLKNAGIFAQQGAGKHGHIILDKEHEERAREILANHLKEGKRGLWDNIHAKRKRIKSGSGERMRKPGSAGAPTAAALKASQTEEVDQIDELNKDTVYSYASKAGKDIDKKHKDLSSQIKSNDPVSANKTSSKIIKRYAGMDRAEPRLNKEEVETLDEGPWFKTSYGWAGGSKPGGGKYKHPDTIKAEKAAGAKAKREAEARAKPVTEEAEEMFDLIEDVIEDIAKQNNVDSELIWEDLESVSDEELLEVAAWQRKEGKNPSGGLNAKGVASYRRENPGSKLQTAVTTKPSKLKAGSKAANRRKSFCARMGGMKKRLTSAETARDPDSRINKALRKWNC